jgi:hypothetical protein
VVTIALFTFLAILVVIIVFVPAPWKTRLRGLAALLAVLAAGVLVVLLARRQDDWSWATTVAAAWVLVALVLAAYEWSASLFRLTTLAAVLAAVVVTAQAGQVQLVRESSIDGRGEATRLDSVLAQTVGPDNTKKLTQVVQTLAAKSTEAIKGFCEISGGTLKPTGQTVDVHETDTCVEPDETVEELASLTKLRTAKADAELAVARLRLAVARETKTASDIASAESAVSNAAQQVARATTKHPVSLEEAIAAGGRGLTTKSPLTTDTVPVPAILGWILLLVAAAYGYRMLEVLNSGRDPGPVTVEDVIGDLGKEKETAEELTSHLRHAVLRNLSEPGTVPGAQATNPVTDLLGTDPVKNPILVAAITIVRAVGFPPRGYLIRTSLRRQAPHGEAGETAAATDNYEVQVRIHDARTKRSVWTTVRAAETRAEALERGGFAAAAWILCQARSVPPWLQFSAEAADALHDFQRSESASGAAAREALENAVVRDPTSGIALLQLGYAYDLEQQGAKALECYERAVAMFPEYRIARYRAAIGWSAMHDVAHTLDTEMKQRLYALTKVRAKEAADGGEWPEGFPLGGALTRFKEVGDCNWVKWLLDLGMRSLSVQEGPELPRPGELRWIHRTLRAASLPTRARQDRIDVRNTKLRRTLSTLGRILAQIDHAGLPDDVLRQRSLKRLQRLERRSRRRLDRAKQRSRKRLNRLDKRARSRNASWQLRYNLACAYAVYYTRYGGNSDLNKALQLLREALLHPDSQQLTRDWLQNDPDLHSLHSNPRFAALLTWTADERRGES